MPLLIRPLHLLVVSMYLAAGVLHAEPLPETVIIPAAEPTQLTRSASPPREDSFKAWTRSHANASSNRYSAFRQVNRSNVSELQLAWEYHSEYSASIQANPIYVDGKVIFPTPGENIVALDAATGEEAWSFKAGSQAALRGLVYWPGNDQVDPRLYFPAGNHLQALDLDGNPVLEFGDSGAATDAKSLVAPAISHGVIIYPVYGNAAVQGLDVVNGELLWETPLLEPLPMEILSDEESYAGGNPWGGIAVDQVRGIAYIATGNPVPTFVGITRPGDNAHANSLVAMDVRNGEILWSFQEIAHDIWDKDIPAPPILTQLNNDGTWVDVVVAVTKQGNTLLLDRLTGQPLFPWRKRRAPASELEGEVLAAYQPDVQLPEPISRQSFSRRDLTRRGPKQHAMARAIYENANAGFFPPFEVGKDTIYFGLRGGAEWPGGAVDPLTGILYVSSNDVPWRIKVINVAGLEAIELDDAAGRSQYLEHCAACHGANLQGSNFSPALYGIEQDRDESSIRRFVEQGQRGMPAYDHLPEHEREAIIDYIQSVKPLVDEEKAGLETSIPPKYQFTGWRLFLDSDGYPASRPPWGWLNALDLNSGKMAWKVPLGSIPELEEKGMGPIGSESLSGAVVTAGGLVFIAGTTDRLVRAFDKTSGKQLWSHELPWVGSAPPTVYWHEGRQYLLVPATGGALGTAKGNAFVAFALPDQAIDRASAKATSH